MSRPDDYDNRFLTAIDTISSTYTDKSTFYENRLSELENALSRSQAELDECQGEVHSLRAELATTKKRLAVSENDLGRCQAELTRLQHHQADRESRLAKLEAFKSAIVSTFDREDVTLTGTAGGVASSSTYDAALHNMSTPYTALGPSRTNFLDSTTHYRPEASHFAVSTLQGSGSTYASPARGGGHTGPPLGHSTARPGPASPARNTAPSSMPPPRVLSTSQLGPSGPASNANPTDAEDPSAFFAEARSRLTPTAFSAVLTLLRSLNAGSITPDSAARQAREAFGAETDLADRFDAMLQ
mmetsp:Transcript_2936/g.9620  ORF Transcript_2936/g.9620 Transcript_2936/m.9620 type:complete len:300 (-) Transcript_2936:511-1410(-)